MNQSDVRMAKNVFGEPLVACSFKPLTGYFRDGACRTNEEDLGTHVVCVVVTLPFLEFSFRNGNDLTTPRPQWQFAGLKPGDQWCLCANHWKTAFEAGVAPQVVLESTHQRVLDLVSLDVLQRFARPVEV
ncbi:DUF2237 family protein [Sulfuriferula thiophila]|uniref:DUF2237 family protein n=1 Tax=Sulfuriferula thiophila TaxID=1781211 RepID=UPI001CB9BC2F|nr:DUF2237 domain-containing protein [Sulfuriferula thiophila]